MCVLFLSFISWSPKDAMALSIEEETTLGDEFFAQVQKYFTVVEDDFLNDYINRVGKYLSEAIEVNPFPFRFYILKDGSLNAFAAPGGRIFIFTGLITETDRLPELAAVICHELGHVSARHLSARVDQGKKIGLATLAGILAGVLIGGPAAGAIITGTMAAGIQTQLHYSRNDEREADQLGFSYMRSAGLDPGSMVSVLSKIERGRWMGTDKVPAYLLTHPTGPERMANIDTLTREHPDLAQREEALRLAEEYPFFRASVLALHMDSSDAMRSFRAEIKKNPGSAPGYYGLGLIMKQRADFAVASEYLSRAMRYAPHSAAVSRGLAEMYQSSGNTEDAIALLNKVLEKDRDDKAALFILAGCYQSKEEHEKAVSIYERLKAFPPVRDDVFHNLGVSYGKLDRLSHAHFNFGFFFKKKGDMRMARFHFEKARELSAGDKEMLERIEKALQPKPRGN
ncbi:MAG: hypothetical protein CO107_12485 [Deltaproteobacteria bacterium CG_4_9_14_3_um_filter_51_14]|nr:MAG: hypothetical protein CO107_12485 [Deltaproteobacteria bacterium CG_4_9_14_3_um_filter_51_14]